MRRRRFLKAATGTTAAAAASTLAAPAIAQARRELRMVTAWPADFPGLGTSAARLAKRITVMSGNTLSVSVHAAGELVGAFDAFDAVADGRAEMYHAAEHYWRGKSPAFTFFAAVPFGLTAGEMTAWIHHGGGQALWDRLAAGFGLKPFLAGNTGPHMGGWFRRPIDGLGDLAGLKVAMPGLGGSVMRRLGASAVALPGRELVGALADGRLDGAEWFGPWLDSELGLPAVAEHYYTPGFHEPGTALSCAVNAEVWDGLTLSQKRVVEAATASETVLAQAEFAARNADALAALDEQRGIKPRRLPDRVLRGLGRAAGDVVAEAGADSEIAAAVYAAFIDFRRKALAWTKHGEQAFVDARLLPFPYGQ